jgi:hypothetical protein
MPGRIEVCCIGLCRDFHRMNGSSGSMKHRGALPITDRDQ